MRAWLILLLLPLAGCLDLDGEPDESGPDGPSGLAGIQAAIGAPIVMDHDHNDADLHTGGYNLQQRGWSPLGVEIGQNGFANFVIWEDEDETLAYVAIDGDTEGGFAIADIADPSNITVVGEYRMDGNSIQEVRVSPDGNWVVMNVQDLPSAAPATYTDLDGAQDCTVCIHVFDVSDRTAPRWVSATPVELLGTHNFHFEEYDDELYLFYVGQPLYNPYPDPGNHVYIARFEVLGDRAALVPVSDFSYNPVDETPGQRENRIFPHDIMVQDHPSGIKVAYMSGWDAGTILFDVTDPMQPTFLGREATVEPSGALAIHWVMQEQAARADGRVIAWSAPEIGSLETDSGVIRAYDVTDPTAPVQIGSWMLPGNVTIEGRYMMSPHTAVPDMETGLLAVAHYHAGVWILDISDPADPQHVAYHFPTGPEDEPIDGPYWWKKPNFSPDGYGPNTYQARWHDGLLWVTDRGTGLYALEYTGPVPGSIA